MEKVRGGESEREWESVRGGERTGKEDNHHDIY